MRTNKSLMIIGVGDLSGLILDMLCKSPQFDKLYLAGRDMAHMLQRSNLVLLVANQLGYYPKIECVSIDLNNIDETTEIISKIRPDIIFNAATMQSWRMITYLPKEIFLKLDEAQFGPWLPMHLTLVYKLMKAVRATGLNIKVINAAFPDAVGAVLKSVDLAPDTGIGNVANIVPALRNAIARQIKQPLESVTVSLYTQHYFSHRIPTFGDSGGSPYHLIIKCNDKDISTQVDHNQIFASVAKDFKRTGGAFRQMITAASAVSIINPMLTNIRTQAHAAGVNGLPGGYKVEVDSNGVSVVIPPNMSIEQLIKINNDCQRFDGIDKIDSDGTVYFTEKEMSIMEDLLGYKCSKMLLTDCEHQAHELGSKFQEFSNKFS